MLRYILSRFAQAVLVMFGVSLLIFYSLHLTGDPAAVMMPPGSSQQEIDNFRHAMGFDRPLLWQYGHYLTGLLHGDLGLSLRYEQPVTELIAQRVPATLLLAVSALAWSTVIGLLLGLVSAASGIYSLACSPLAARPCRYSG
jgi:glutathione transport system permease protein